jgi:hypothetical protein
MMGSERSKRVGRVFVPAGLAAAMAAAGLSVGTAVAAAETPPPAGQTAGESDLEERIRQLEAMLRALRAELDQLRRDADPGAGARIAELEKQVEVLTEEIERQRLGRVYRAPTESRFGLGPAASKVYTVERGVSIGGYGEMLYQDFAPERDDGTASDETDQLDFLRAVFYFGYKFNDRILVNSEVEIEHASTGEEGEVSLEFAYLDFLLQEAFNVRAGLLLTPVGFLNEMHEPPIFLGARRPQVERVILPTTWRENGAGVFGDLGPVAYRAYVMNGLDSSGFSASSGIRGGRQDGSEAAAEDFAFVARFDWTILPGLLLGASGYTGDSSQGAVTAAGQPFAGRVTLYDLHADWRWRGLQARALWSGVRIGDAAQINEANGLTGDQSVGSRFGGWYAELGYDVLSGRRTGQALIPYVRYESYNTQEEVPAGFAADRANDVELWTLGIAYRPILQVVLKIDYQDFENAAGTGVDQFNVALGYLF